MRFIEDIKKYRGYIKYAIKSGLKAEVAGSYLNWLWWILEPFCFMLIYATIFGMIFETSELYFPVFIFVGNAMWTFFSKCIGLSVSLVKQNETIIAKVYVPKYVLLLVEMGINGVKLLLNFVIVAIMLFFFRIPISIYVIWSVPILLIFFINTFAIAVFFMHWGVYIEDLAYVVSIVLNMMMFFTGVFYSVESRLDYPYGILLGTLNPVAFLMTSMRKAVMYSQCPDVGLFIIWGMISVIIALFGIRMLYKNENDYVKVI